MTSATSTTAPTAATCTQADPKALESLLPITVPAGFAVQPDNVGDTGPSDLQKATKDDGGADAAAVLRQDGFRRGYQRLWMDQGNRKLTAFIYEFCSVDGASAYAARIAKLDASGATPFTVTGVHGATGVTGTNQGDVFAHVRATPGRYVVQARAHGAVTALTTAQAEQLATGVAASLVAVLTAPA